MKQWMMIAAAIAGFALHPAASAVAAGYPVRPITLIVPQAPGGGNDVIARILAETMSRTLGQQIIVENRPGAGGTIGTRQLAKSPPDGYTLVMGSTGTVAMAPSVFPNVGYDPRKDFAPIGLIARSAIVLVVGPAVAARSVHLRGQVVEHTDFVPALEQLICEVTDNGRIGHPLAGRQLPSDDSVGGRGLWMANQLCDLVQIRTFADSSVVRLHMRTR